jgi:hypothetical protein
MQRREFVTLVAGAAAWPGGVGAATAWAPLVASFEQRLCELGWIDGHTVSIVYRRAEGKSGRFGEVATEFVRLRSMSSLPWIAQLRRHSGAFLSGK